MKIEISRASSTSETRMEKKNYRITRNFRGLKFSLFFTDQLQTAKILPSKFCQLRHVVNTSLSQIAHPQKQNRKNSLKGQSANIFVLLAIW